jgi:O-antigen/teichoic acid export membrane protein
MDGHRVSRRQPRYNNPGIQVINHKISNTSINILSNFAGKGWHAIMSLAFIPIYIKFMGIESYGIIGIYLSLQALFSVLDFGLSTTLNRELSRLSASSDQAAEMRETTRTLEILYWCISILICIVILLSSHVISKFWVNAKSMAPSDVSLAIVLIGFNISFLWPFTLYSGGLIGLQRQVLLNAIIIASTTIRSVGAALILWKISPTIHAFFIWQIAISILQTLAARIGLNASLPTIPGHSRFNKKILLRLWRFAAGMTGITALAVILSQLDKIILSKILTLEMFGYYSFAATVAAGLNHLVTPLSTAIFPRFSQLVTMDDRATLKYFYHHCCQLMSLIIIPAAVLVAAFSKPIIILWTNDSSIAENSYLVLSLLITAHAINGLMNLPLALQIAHGWTRLTFCIYLYSVILGAPAIVAVSTLLGAPGTAGILILINLIYLILGTHFMHKKILPTEKWQWYLIDIGLPLMTVCAILFLGSSFINQSFSRMHMFFSLAGLAIVAYLLTALSLPMVRRQIRQLSYARHWI